MIFNSIEFLVFFPIVVAAYFLVPNKIKNMWLLIASYYFYMCWNAKYALLILFSTVVTYWSGILLERVKPYSVDNKEEIRYKKGIVAFCVCINLSILFVFKYLSFAVESMVYMANVIGIQVNAPTYDIVLPVGISFYTFQALGYLIDVYRGEIYAEKSFLNYALYVSFFPQLVAGPIERSKNLLKQLSISKKFSASNFVEGLLLMIWGFFLKIVIADRIAIVVDNIYGNYNSFAGWYLIIATMLFAIQIYCDFYGYSVIAMGTAKILGIQLMENFDAPYLAVSVEEFWRRWHISLTSWFKDYLYIPLGGSRRGRRRKLINKLIVFLISGLWHGAKFTYVIWGALNGAFQVVGELSKPFREKIYAKCNVNCCAKTYVVMQRIITFCLIDFTWIFFRANSIEDAFAIINIILTESNLAGLAKFSVSACGIDVKNFVLLLVCIIILLAADICKYNKIVLRNKLLSINSIYRSVIIAVLIWAILIFGIWGPSYDSSNFIYFQF